MPLIAAVNQFRRAPASKPAAPARCQQAVIISGRRIRSRWSPRGVWWGTVLTRCTQHSPSNAMQLLVEVDLEAGLRLGWIERFGCLMFRFADAQLMTAGVAKADWRGSRRRILECKR